MIKATSHNVKRTQQYLIDLYNGTFFSDKIHWDSVDLFNSLPVISSEDDTEGDNYLRKEIRGALLVHKRFFYGCCLSVCAESGVTDRVCYRLSPLSNAIKLDESNRVVLPMKHKFDVSFSDLNMGADDMGAYCYYNGTPVLDSGSSQSSVFSILKFTLDADIVVAYVPEIFDTLTYDATTHIPLVGDAHHASVFSVEKND